METSGSPRSYPILSSGERDRASNLFASAQRCSRGEVKGSGLRALARRGDASSGERRNAERGGPSRPPPQLTHIGTGSGLRSLVKRRERAGVASDATGWTVDRAAVARRVRAAMGRFLSPDTGASPTLGHEKTEGTGVYVL
jgi:hypothetical protein